MVNAPPVLRHVCRLLTAQSSATLPDHQLLQRFVAQQDEGAFEALVLRHGSMVLGVCRRVLRHEQDAEDAFQATFLVFARKAGSIRKQGSLSSWLHAVAQRVAGKARAAALRRAAREREERPVTEEGNLEVVTWRELRAVLDAELPRLPEEWRAPLVLCYLEGQTRDEAAQRLGWTRSTFRKRLERGRELLRHRLARRGLTLSAGLFATLLAGPVASAALVNDVVRAALGQQTLRSARAATLAEGVLRTMTPGRLRIATAALFLATVLATGARVLSSHQPGDAPVRVAAAATAERRKTAADAQGDPLPAGAVARLGTLRWRHGERVSSVTFSPDGTRLASASWDHTVGLWEVATGKRLRTFRGHKGFVTCVRFTPDGKSLVSGAEDNIRLWDVNTGKERQQFKHAGWVWSVALSHDGKTLAAHTNNVPAGCISLWDVGTGGKLRELVFEGNQDGVMALDFSPDGKKLVSGGDRVLRLFDVTTGKQLDLFGAGKQTRALAFAPDGKTFAVGRHDTVARIYDAATLKVRHELPGHEYLARCLTYSPDSKTLITGDGGKTLRLWNVATGKKVREITGDDFLECVAVSPDGATLATGSLGSTIRLWDAATGKQRGAVSGHQTWLTFAAFTESKTVVSVDLGGSIRLWDATTGKEPRQLAVERDYTGSVALSPDRRTLALGGSPGIRLYDLTAGKEVRKPKGHERQIFSLSFSPKGDVLASCAHLDRSIRLWDVTTGKELREIRTRHQNAPQCMAFSPDGTRLVSGGEFDHSLCLWDAASGKLIHQWPAHGKSEDRYSRGVSAVAFSADGSLLASSGADRVIRLWDATTGKSRGQLIGHQGGYGPPVFSPDGRMLASSGSDGTIRLWELATGKERRSFEGHLGAVGRPDFSPDGKWLVTASMDTSALVWVVAGRDIAIPQGSSLTAEELMRLWQDLADDDAVRAYRAAGTLAAAPKQALPWLQVRLRRQAAADPGRIAGLIKNLDDKKFAVRDEAARELEKLRELAAPLLRKVRESQPTPEARLRVERLLEKLEGTLQAGETVRALRSIEVLEQVGSLEAQRLLERLARDIPGGRIEKEAKLSLKRLGDRK
jgi:RNA polymerase sigma factor (sigma-70 family)